MRVVCLALGFWALGQVEAANTTTTKVPAKKVQISGSMSVTSDNCATHSKNQKFVRACLDAMANATGVKKTSVTSSGTPTCEARRRLTNGRLLNAKNTMKLGYKMEVPAGTTAADQINKVKSVSTTKLASLINTEITAQNLGIAAVTVSSIGVPAEVVATTTKKKEAVNSAPRMDGAFVTILAMLLAPSISF